MLGLLLWSVMAVFSSINYTFLEKGDGDPQALFSVSPAVVKQGLVTEFWLRGCNRSSVPYLWRAGVYRGVADPVITGLLLWFSHIQMLGYWASKIPMSIESKSKPVFYSLAGTTMWGWTEAITLDHEMAFWGEQNHVTKGNLSDSLETACDYPNNSLCHLRSGVLVFQCL